MIIIPTSGQLQIPGSFQSYARISLTLAPNAAVTRNLTDPGEPERITPDAGVIIWRYTESGVQRYGQPLPITMTEQFIFTDYPQLAIDQLLVVLRFGVTGPISIRRKSI
jgi:hypothetical protein